MTNDNPEFFALHWQGIDIRIGFVRCWIDLPGGPLSRLDIRSVNPPRAPLPVSETGYWVRYLGDCEHDTPQEIIDMVREWLDETAKEKPWKDYVEQSRQLCLF